MTMNSSGAISLGGTTAGQSIELENGGPGTAQISLDDPAVRTLAGVPGSGTTIIMPTNFYGKSNTVTLNLIIAANTYSYDVYANAVASPVYVVGKTNVTVTVNPGVTVGNSGGYAMLVPSSFSPTDNITIVNNSYIVGYGGGGGSGGTRGGNAGLPGGAGASAVYVNRPTTITNNGVIGAGGGGGGGGGISTSGAVSGTGGGGGGGGAGYNAGGGGGAGSGASGGNPGNPGGSGALTTGGGGGNGGGPTGPKVNTGNGGAGGSGGGLGAGGNPGGTGSTGGTAGSGGGTGNYITGNPFVTWPATGTRLGGVA